MAAILYVILMFAVFTGPGTFFAFAYAFVIVSVVRKVSTTNRAESLAFIH